MALTVQVVTPEREVTVAENVTMVIAKGIEGDLGVLPGRAPALIALGLGPLVIEQEGGDRHEILLDGGFMTVKNDNVIVLAEYAVLPDEFNETEVQAEVERLRQRLTAAEAEEETRHALARAEALRAMVRT